MDFSWLSELMTGLPTELRFILIMIVLGIVYKIVDVKYLSNRVDDNLAIEEQIANIEKHVTNHISHDLKDLGQELKALSATVRDLTEQVNRSVNSVNVVLNKQDQARDMLFEIRGEMRRG